MRNSPLQLREMAPAESFASTVTFVVRSTIGSVHACTAGEGKPVTGPTIGSNLVPFRYASVTIRSSGRSRSSTIVHVIAIVEPPLRQPMRARAGADTRGGSLIVKVQGFGTRPGTRLLPWRSCPDTVATYVVPAARSVRPVRTVPFPLQLVTIDVGLGFRVRRTDKGSIDSVNVTTMSRPAGTFVWPSAGAVARMMGRSHALRNDHVFGTVPGTSARLSSESLAATWMSYTVHDASPPVGVRRR